MGGRSNFGWTALLIIPLILFGSLITVDDREPGKIYALMNLSAPEVPTGLATFKVQNGINSTYLSINDVMLFDYYSHEWYANVSTGSVYVINRSSIATVWIDGHYPAYSIAVEASGTSNGGSPVENILYVYPEAEITEVSFFLTRIDDSEIGNYSVNDISNGWHSLFFTIETPLTAVFGASAYLPNTTYDDQYTLDLSINGIGCWIGWNGTVKNLTNFNHDYFTFQLDSQLNVTYITSNWWKRNLVFYGYFENMKDIFLYDYFIGNYNGSIVINLLKN